MMSTDLNIGSRRANTIETDEQIPTETIKPAPQPVPRRSFRKAVPQEFAIECFGATAQRGDLGVFVHGTTYTKAMLGDKRWAETVCRLHNAGIEGLRLVPVD